MSSLPQTPSLESLTIGFIGCGNIAQAVGGAIIKKGVLKPTQVRVSAPTARNFGFWQSFGVEFTHDNTKILAADIVFLAVKPQYLAETMKQLFVQTACTHKDNIFVSLIAGVTVEMLANLFPKSDTRPRIARVMTNILAGYSEGCSAYCEGAGILPNDGHTVKTLMEAGGLCIDLPESQFDAFGALGGSAAAFVFMMAEALAEGGVRMGLSRHVSARIAAQVVAGSGKMLVESGTHPAVLRENVSSPGGTTVEGVHVLEKGNFRGTVAEAISATTLKARELQKFVSKT